MLAIRFPPDLESRLAELADKTGRTKSFYARAAIEEYIEDLEDYYLAEEVMKRFRPQDAIPLDELIAGLDLED